MRKTAYCAVGALLALSLFGAGKALANDGDRDRDDHGSTCHFRSDDSRIQHIVHIQFDNVHFRRDNPNVPSDLEQIPSLLNFLEGEGTLLANHHTPLISHTSVDILTTLTGVYGEKMGIPIGNTILFYNPDGTVRFNSAFNYWTDNLEPATATTPAVPHMVDQRGKIAPAPWVAFTRAGCNVGAFSTANIEFENVRGDITTAFGAGSPEDLHQQTVNALKTNLPTNTPDPAVNAANAATNAANQGQKDKLVADFEGIAIHCAKNSKVCGTKGTTDALPDEPGGYVGFNALFGNVNVAPAINHGNGFVLDLDGNHVDDGNGHDGFPGFDPSPSQTLGYLAQMLENGVPVVYGYIEDAHDNHDVASNPDGAFGPGDAGYVSQLKEFDKAFGEFFARLKKHGITKENTLFIVTSDENDHFAGGPPSPANCDGVNVPCTYAKLGEVQASLTNLYFTEFGNSTRFDIDFDDAPAIWIDHNQGGQTDAVTRQFETQAGGLIGFDPITGTTNNVTQRLADQAEQSFLHMITSDPRRTPNFILFGNPDYFLSTSAPKTCSPLASCFSESRDHAWNHGDFQEEIVHTWLGVVGPGVKEEGVNHSLFTDHTDIRPTMLRLVGLKDDYAHDGRVVFEILKDDAMPDSLNDHEGTLHRLAVAYKDINAPVGKLGLKTLALATTGAEGSDAAYAMVTAQIKAITAKRNAIAGKMIDMLEDAAFDGREIDPEDANELIAQAHALLESVGLADDHDDHHNDGE